MSEHRLSFSIPLDDDGFLRRECPHCEREFKWRPDPEDAAPERSVPMPEDGYACPYCAGRAGADAWWTKPKLEHAEQLAASEILRPELKQLERRPDPRSMISLLARAQAEARLQVDLHPRLAERVRAQFLLGEYEAAAFLAMREVEICVRDRAGARDADLGVALMKSAFGEDGPLNDPQLERGEQQAKMALYWGPSARSRTHPATDRSTSTSRPSPAR